MHYSLFIIIFLSTMIGQTIVGSRIGSDPFTGSSRSTAMGNTHLLNSSFSYSARYNAARIPSISQNKYNFSIQLNRYGVFERRSLIMKDFFGDFLTYGDYVSNEYSFYQISGGLASSISIDELKLGFGLNHAPLTHFKYKYLEEVRGNYSLDDGEYGSKDPIVGYHTLEIDGTIMMSSLGLGIQTGPISFGVSVNQVHPSNRKGYLGVDSLYEDVSNLSTYPDINTNAKTSKTNFLSFSTQCILNPNLIIAASFEEMTRINIDSSLVDVENNYAYYNLKGYDSYIKPSMESLAISFISKKEQDITISFEYNNIKYAEDSGLKNYQKHKFGFEYISSSGTPIRGGFSYIKERVLGLTTPVSMFTFGTGKKINHLTIDCSMNYSTQEFQTPELFPIEGDIRSDYDLVRESLFDLTISFNYEL